MMITIDEIAELCEKASFGQDWLKYCLENINNKYTLAKMVDTGFFEPHWQSEILITATASSDFPAVFAQYVTTHGLVMLSYLYDKSLEQHATATREGE